MGEHQTSDDLATPGHDAALLRAALTLLDPVHIDEFPKHVAGALSAVVHSDCVAYTEIDPMNERHVSVLVPEVSYSDAQYEAFASLALQNPLVAHYFNDGDTHAHRVSDFIPLDDWHATELWRQVYGPFGYNYQLAITLPARLPLVIGIAFHRTEPDFVDEDVQRLNHLRAHVVAAHRNAMLFSRLEAGNQALLEFVEREHGAVALLYPDGRLNPMGSDLVPLLRRHRVDGQPIDNQVLHKYMASADQRIRGDPLNNPGIVRHHVMASEPGPELVIAFSPGWQGQPGLVVASEQGEVHTARTALAFGLSERETDVANALSLGLSNSEIGTHLSISTGTVRKHLENIFAKLGVNNRTAAALLIRDGQR